jgi:hypothetical protein
MKEGLGPLTGMGKLVEGIKHKIVVDRTWDDFMRKPRDSKQLQAIITDPEIQPEYQQRAIQTLLAPNIKNLSLNADSKNFLGDVRDWIGKLSEKQAEYASGLLPGYIKQAGFSYAYNNIAIPNLISRLPQAQAEELFKSFQISKNDHFAYAPLEDFLGSNVNESWKRKALEQMHGQIDREQAGEPPRHNNRSTLQYYAEMLNLSLYRDKPAFNNELFQEEVGYMLRTISDDRVIIYRFQTKKVLDRLEDKEVRHAFARRQILAPFTGLIHHEGEERQPFRILDKEDEELASKLIEEFPEDKELTIFLQAELQTFSDFQVKKKLEAEKDRLTNRLIQEKETERDQKILKKMRTPLAKK